MRGTTLYSQIYRYICLSRAAPALVGRYANTVMGVTSVPTRNLAQRLKVIFKSKGTYSLTPNGTRFWTLNFTLLSHCVL